MTDAEDDHKEYRSYDRRSFAAAVDQGSQLVEYAGDNAARQHQGHQTGIGKEVSQISRGSVVQSADDSRDLSEAFVRENGPQHHHGQSDKENDRSLAQQEVNQQSDDDHPPGHVVEDRVDPVSFPAF